jgi:hypothetical protein
VCLVEQRSEQKQSKNFANQSWLQHVKRTTSDVTAREIMHMLRGAELHNTQMVLGEVRSWLFETEFDRSVTRAAVHTDAALSLNIRMADYARPLESLLNLLSPLAAQLLSLAFLQRVLGVSAGACASVLTACKRVASQWLGLL